MCCPTTEAAQDAGLWQEWHYDYGLLTGGDVHHRSPSLHASMLSIHAQDLHRGWAGILAPTYRFEGGQVESSVIGAGLLIRDR